MDIAITPDTTVRELFLGYAQLVQQYRTAFLAAHDNQFDGLAFWQPWKSVFSRSNWQGDIWHPTPERLQQFAAESAFLEDLDQVGETWHFLLQLYRLGSFSVERSDGTVIPNRITLVKLLQYALNHGQLLSSPYDIGEYYLPPIERVISPETGSATLGQLMAPETIQKIAQMFREHRV